MVLITTDFPDVDKVLSICEFCPLQEFNNRILSLLVDGRKISVNHSWTRFDINLPDLDASTWTFSGMNKFFFILGPNIPSFSWNTINNGDNKVPLAEIRG